MRQAQSALDEANADRTRTLAAFAVTVGSDAAVADLMGLPEREVRVARRTVGKDHARTVANQLLTPAAEATAPPHATALNWPEPEPEAAHVPPPVPGPRTESVTVPVPGAPPLMPTASAADDAVTWSAGMDSVLQWSWQSGLDLQAVAEELGINSRTLLTRAQVLAAEGRLSPRSPSGDLGQAGRHRRHEAMPPYHRIPDSPESLYSSPSPY
ncbi:hypothetical protein [Streptomyces hypolithicus]